MGIMVSINPALYQHGNKRGIAKVSGDTVGECLEQLVKQFDGIEKILFDKNGKLLQYIDIYLNGESVYPEEWDRAVKDGDELNVTFTIAGG